jgi:hypothetical protein
MGQTRWNSAKLAKVAREQAQVKQPARVIHTDTAEQPAKLGVFAGHRAGKRRRGVSVTKRAPRDVTRVSVFDVLDTDGNAVLFDVHTVEQRIAPVARKVAPFVHGHARYPLTLAEHLRTLAD